MLIFMYIYNVIDVLISKVKTKNKLYLFGDFFLIWMYTSKWKHSSNVFNEHHYIFFLFELGNENVLVHFENKAFGYCSFKVWNTDRTDRKIIGARHSVLWDNVIKSLAVHTLKIIILSLCCVPPKIIHKELLNRLFINELENKCIKCHNASWQNNSFSFIPYLLKPNSFSVVLLNSRPKNKEIISNETWIIILYFRRLS